MSLTTLILERGVDEEGTTNQPATGAVLPSGRVVLEWDPAFFPPEDRTEEPSLSIYESIEDCEQATGGDVRLGFDDHIPDDIRHGEPAKVGEQA
jgi:hypothetical protein